MIDIFGYWVQFLTLMLLLDYFSDYSFSPKKSILVQTTTPLFVMHNALYIVIVPYKFTIVQNAKVYSFGLNCWKYIK